MLTFQHLLYGTLTFIIFLIVYFGCKYIIKPYLLLQFYKKQGIETEFLPIVGETSRNEQNVHKHGDLHYSDKQKALQTPKPKAWAVTVGDTVIVYLKDHELIKNFYLNHDQFYEKYLPSIALEKAMVGDGVLFSEGAVWKKHRKLASAAFNFEFLKEMIPEVTESSNELLDKIKNRQDLDTIDMLQEMQAVTGEIVGRIFFGQEFSQYKLNGVSITQYLTDLLAEAGAEDFQPYNWALGPILRRAGTLTPYGKVLKRIKEFRATIKNIAAQKLEDTEKEEKEGAKGKRRRVNLMELFYKQRKQNPQEAFTDDEIVDEFITFFLTGTDTTGHVITMLTYWLLKHPQFKDKVLQEVNDIFCDVSNVSLDTLNKMDYVTALLKETLRVTPIGGILFDRIAKKDNDLGGLIIKKGSLVNISFLSNYYDPEYHDDPYAFNPERWLEESKTKRNVSQNPFIYTPFSSGTRNCIGQHLGMNEAKIIFSLFVKKFEYKLTDPDYVLKMTMRHLYEPYDPIFYKLDTK